jgi:ABC-2 type transport system permease protein
MFRVEWAKAARRWRTWLVAAVLAAIPVIMTLAVKFSPPPAGTQSQDAPPFLLQIIRNGLFVPLTSLIVIQPFFLPLACGLFAGDSIAGEAQGGTLRYLLIRPVGRARLVLTKYFAAMSLLAMMLVIVTLTGLAAGGAVFGIHPLSTFSGTTVTVGASLARILGTAVYMVVAISGLAAIGVFISTLTDSGPGAAVATIVVAIASEILDNISSLHRIQPYLPTHGWTGFTGLFRFPVDWAPMRTGVILSVVYTVVFLTAALWRFRTKDVTA